MSETHPKKPRKALHHFTTKSLFDAISPLPFRSHQQRQHQDRHQMQNQNQLQHEPPSRDRPLPARPKPRYTLSPLPYAYDALEPYISKQALILHHTRHHQTCVNHLNTAVEAQLALMDSGSTIDVSAQIALQGSVRFNGGGHVNHSFFWKGLAPVSFFLFFLVFFSLWEKGLAVLPMPLFRSPSNTIKDINMFMVDCRLFMFGS